MVAKILVVVASKHVKEGVVVFLGVANQLGSHLVPRILVLGAYDCHDAVLAHIGKEGRNVALELDCVEVSVVGEDFEELGRIGPRPLAPCVCTPVP